MRALTKVCDEVKNSILKVEPRISKMVKCAPSVKRITVLLYEKEDWLGEARFEYSYDVGRAEFM